MSWPAYPSYKESGVEWLGGVPSHWGVDRIKWSVESSQNGIWGEEADGGPHDIRCVRVADFDRPKLSIQDRDVTYRRVTPQERKGRLLAKGDLILEKSGGGEKNPVGFVVLYDQDEPAVTSNFMARVSLRPEMEPRFWTYLHSSLYKSRLTQPSIKQTSGIQNLDQQSYFDERVCFPPSDEQRLISDWLDAETTSIDALIAKQEQLIATLREDRTATITDAVTKGLDRHAVMTNSGVEWLGEQPISWSHQKLAWLFTFHNGDRGVNYPSSEEMIDDGVPFINAGHLTDGRINFSAMNYISEDKYAAMGGAKLRQGDILYCLRGSLGKNALADSLPRGGALASSLVALRSIDPSRLDPRFGFWLVNSAAEEAQRTVISSGSAQPNLAVDDVARFIFGVPPISQQRHIVEYLDTRCGEIDALISKADKVIGTLREFRAALITDAVTGKIDVRGTACR